MIIGPPGWTGEAGKVDFSEVDVLFTFEPFELDIPPLEFDVQPVTFDVEPLLLDWDEIFDALDLSALCETNATRSP
jgi:hypothetical protein